MLLFKKDKFENDWFPLEQNNQGMTLGDFPNIVMTTGHYAMATQTQLSRCKIVRTCLRKKITSRVHLQSDKFVGRQEIKKRIGHATALGMFFGGDRGSNNGISSFFQKRAAPVSL